MQVSFLQLFNELLLRSASYFLAKIYGVRWSLSGDLIAIATTSYSAKLWDLKTRKMICVGDDSSNLPFFQLVHPHRNISACSLSMLYLSEGRV